MNEKTILHIANGFDTSPLYANLLDKLKLHVRDQGIVCFARKSAQSNCNARETQGYSTFVHGVHKPWHSIFFSLKIRSFFQLLVEPIKTINPDIIHAHTLYSDGALAYQAKIKYGIPYLIAVRNTDLNYFAKYRPDLANYRDRILGDSSKIILISPAYEKKLRATVGEQFWLKIKGKVAIIPNGIDDFWHKNTPKTRRPYDPKIKILYVGNFSRNKNVLGILDAYTLLKKTRDGALTLVGGGSYNHKNVIRTIESMGDSNIKYLGIIKDKNILAQIYRSHDILVMPSIHETFGLSYVEALSQGTPCIHSWGEGIDGYFSNEKVSFACNPRDPSDIADKIVKAKDDGIDRFNTCIDSSLIFNWSKIAEKYAEIYRCIAN